MTYPHPKAVGKMVFHWFSFSPLGICQFPGLRKYMIEVESMICFKISKVRRWKKPEPLWSWWNRKTNNSNNKGGVQKTDRATRPAPVPPSSSQLASIMASSKTSWEVGMLKDSGDGWWVKICQCRYTPENEHGGPPKWWFGKGIFWYLC